MKLSTTQRIVLSFTGSTVTIVLFFAIALNIFFFTNWYSGEQKALRSVSSPQFNKEKVQNRISQSTLPKPVKKRLSDSFSRSNSLPISDDKAQEIIAMKGVWRENIILYEGERYLRQTTKRSVNLRHITPVIERQRHLFRLSWILIIISGLLTAGVGYIVVKRALRDLTHLSEFVDSLDIDSLQQTISFDHLPKEDEIQNVAMALTQMNLKLHNQVAHIKQFMANVAHEFKTPLMVMQTSTDLSLKTKKYKEGLQKNISSIQQLNRLIEALSSIVYSETKTLEKQTIHLIPVIESVKDSIASVYNKKITRKLRSQPNIHIETDLGILEHILMNLLDNARKYTDEGGTVSVEVTEATITIKDTGKGMNSHTLETMRKPFWQADKSRGVDTGFGLGMSLVKTLIQRLGRSIDVDSKIGKGTTFTLHR